MRTLLFCTSWFDSKQRWHDIYGRWLAYYLREHAPIRFDHLMFIDDASPMPPDDPRVAVIEEDEWPDALPQVSLYRHRERLGRHGLFNYPGWWRSYFRSIDVARRYGIGKVVHLECDAFVLSQRLADHINGLEQDWTSMWCPRYTFPETAIQVICEHEFPEVEKMRARGLDDLVGWAAELELPFSNIETRWIGDRYGEFLKTIPEDADYVCQTRLNMPLPVKLR